MIFYLLAAVLTFFGVLMVLLGLTIRESREITGERHTYGDAGFFLSGIALLCVALPVFVVTYIVRNAP